MGWDYYRNLREADFDRVTLAKHFSQYAFLVSHYFNDLYFIGFRTGVPRSDAIAAKFRNVENELKALRNGDRRTIWRRAYDLPASLARWTLSKKQFANFEYYYYGRITSLRDKLRQRNSNS
jgi:GH43 family beta-xylosidase